MAPKESSLERCQLPVNANNALFGVEMTSSTLWKPWIVTRVGWEYWTLSAKASMLNWRSSREKMTGRLFLSFLGWNSLNEAETLAFCHLPHLGWKTSIRTSRSDIERSLNFVSIYQNLKTEETVTSTMTAMDYPAQQVDYTNRYSDTTCRTNHCNLGSKKSAILQKNLQIKAHHDRREHRAREPSTGNDFTE